MKFLVYIVLGAARIAACQHALCCVRPERCLNASFTYRPGCPGFARKLSFDFRQSLFYLFFLNFRSNISRYDTSIIQRYRGMILQRSSQCVPETRKKNCTWLPVVAWCVLVFKRAIQAEVVLGYDCFVILPSRAPPVSCPR